MTPQQQEALLAAARYIGYYRHNQCLPTASPQMQSAVMHAYKCLTGSAFDFSCAGCVQIAMQQLCAQLASLESETISPKIQTHEKG